VQLRGVGLFSGIAVGVVHLQTSSGSDSEISAGDRRSPPGAPLDRSPSGTYAGTILACDALEIPTVESMESRAWQGLILEGSPSKSLRGDRLRIPTVAELDRDLFREGERARVDGTGGTVELTGVKEIGVVTSFIERLDGAVLLLRRSELVGSFRGRWAGVSGFLEEPTPLAQAYKEIGEETGIQPDQLRLASEGHEVYARDGQRIFRVHPFRFLVTEESVSLDWEHSEYAWVRPEEIPRKETVPKLDRVWAAVAGGQRPSGESSGETEPKG